MSLVGIFIGSLNYSRLKIVLLLIGILDNKAVKNWESLQLSRNVAKDFVLVIFLTNWWDLYHIDDYFD